MRIGLIADTHGNVVGWDRAMEVALAGSDVIVHCGDVLYHGPKFEPVEGYDPQALAARINDSTVPVLIARGNGDSEVDQLVLDVPVQSPYALAQLDGTRMLAAHGHIEPPETLMPLAQRWGIDLLVTGHVHVPVAHRDGGLLHVNPGTVTYPLAEEAALARRTCAVWEDGNVTHYDIDEGRVIDLPD